MTLPTVVTAWQDLRLWDLCGWPLPVLDRPLDRVLTRAAATLARRQVQAIAGWERVLPACDPFILVANHGSRREALYLPAALMLARGGCPVHFLADWNFRLIPGAGYLYEGSGAITVARKEARPRWLNRFRSRYVAQTPPLEQAMQRLGAGGSVAIFPEGTVNRDPRCLLRGRFGAARLSLETGVPLLPVGIRFHPPHGGEGRRASNAPMSVHVGSPMHPPGPAMDEADIGAVRAWHAELMSAIAGLCGKPWPPTGGTAAPSVPSTATERQALGAGGPAC